MGAMGETLRPAIGEARERSCWSPGASLMTPLGTIEGEVLEYLDRHHTATLRRLNRELAAPSYMVVMAVGALIRTGLVRGAQHDLEVVVKRRTSLHELRDQHHGGAG